MEPEYIHQDTMQRHLGEANKTPIKPTATYIEPNFSPSKISPQWKRSIDGFKVCFTLEIIFYSIAFQTAVYTMSHVLFQVISTGIQVVCEK